MAKDPNFMDWDDELSSDSEFKLLPEGDYNFEVMSYERGSYPGSEKISPCNKVIMTLKLSDNAGNQTIIKHDFILWKTIEFKISEFYVSIGLKKRGENAPMRWKDTVGGKGCCKVTIEKWTGKDGSQKEKNKVTKFYEPADLGVNVATAPAKQGNMFASKR